MQKLYSGVCNSRANDTNQPKVGAEMTAIPPSLPSSPTSVTYKPKAALSMQTAGANSLFCLVNNNWDPQTKLVDACILRQVNHTVLLLTK